MSQALTGYARCSAGAQELTAQRDRLRELGAAGDRIYPERLAVRCGLSEDAGLDAGSVARQPSAQPGLTRIARADHHFVAAIAEPGGQAPPGLSVPHPWKRNRSPAPPRLDPESPARRSRSRPAAGVRQ